MARAHPAVERPHLKLNIRTCRDVAGDVSRETRSSLVPAILELVHSFRIETVIAASAEACFDLSLSVDAHAASMAASGERAIAGVSTGVMTLGDSVTWQARHFGIPFRMTSAVTEYERPVRFVDEQQRGPFRRWWHEHTFTALPDGRTLMVDTIEFGSPWRPFGFLADRVVLGRYMPSLVRKRNNWLKAALEAA